MNVLLNDQEAPILDRRKILTAGGLGILGLSALAIPIATVSGKTPETLPVSKMPRPFTLPFKVPPLLQPMKTTIDPLDGATIQHYTVTAQPAFQEIAPGFKTPILGYNGIFPGPTLSIEQGVKTRLTVRNQIPLSSGAHHAGHDSKKDSPIELSTHLHGSASLPQYDGYANDLTAPGYRKEYHYPNFQPARSLWYHDHAVHSTAENVYSGLAGMYQLHDPAEKATLPQGEFDVPIVVSDITLDSRGTMYFDDHEYSGMWGDMILVNGVPWPVMKVKRRIYRFRFLVASITRSYRFRLSNQGPMTVVATDGGMMAKAATVSSFRQAGAERYEVLIDFSKYPAGTEIVLQNASNKNNIDYNTTNKVMKFVVTDEPFTTNDPGALVMPNIVSTDPVMTRAASSAIKTRRMRVKKEHDDVWVIANTRWEEVAASGFQKVSANPNLNDVEIWEIENSSGGWFHPVHIHLVDFKILSRNGKGAFTYENGPKDVVYVGEGETVRLLMRFEHNRGRYMIHCHNLPHEDHDMMTQFSVGYKAGDPDPNDPIAAARPVPDTPIA